MGVDLDLFLDKSKTLNEGAILFNEYAVDSAGNTVIVIEHNTSVIKNADWIIDMGPEGGTKGGKVMFEGTPKQLLTAKNSLTSEYIGN